MARLMRWGNGSLTHMFQKVILFSFSKAEQSRVAILLFSFLDHYSGDRRLSDYFFNVFYYVSLVSALIIAW
jgi:hypothetical protein